MVALSIDTATGICAVAISDQNSAKSLSSISNDIGRGHAETLMGYINMCLDESGHIYKDISKVICTIGPGSFTGVRVGLSCARAIAMALDVPVIGVSNIHACAVYAQLNSASQNVNVSVILDARRDELYFQSFENGAPIGEAQVTSIDELTDNRHELIDDKCILCGSGARAFISYLQERDIDTDYQLAHKLPTAPIETIARIGLKKMPDEERPLPLYLRKPDAKPQNSFAVARTS